MYSIRKLLTSMHYYSRVVINFHTVLNAYYIYIYIYNAYYYILESTCVVSVLTWLATTTTRSS